jgi:hypothetical protein
MSTRQYLASLVVGCALVVAAGCDRQPSQPKATTNTPVPPPPASEAIEKAKEAAAKAGQKISDTVTDAKNSDAAKSAQATASDAMAKTKEQGAELLGKLDAAIKANRLDEAQTYVDAFDKIKANVPDDLKARYESLKTQLKAAKDKATTPQPAPATPAEPNK